MALTIKDFTLDADLDITGFPYLLSKSNNVTLTKNQCVDLDGAASPNTDYVSVNGLITQCALYETGCIIGSFRTDIDTGASNAIWVFGRNADASSTYLRAYYNMSTDTIVVECLSNGTVYWRWTSAGNVTDPLIANWARIAVDHDGTSATIYLDGVDITAAGTWNVTTDKTKWTKSVITDSAKPADNFALGAHVWNGVTAYLPWNGQIDKFQVYSTNKGAVFIAADAAEDRIGGVNAPADCVCNLHFRGDANDVSGYGNHGTLVDGAAIIDDPETTGIYATTSPEFYLVESGNEYAFDASAGMYHLFATLFENSTLGFSGTSIKWKYATSNTSTRAGVSWSAGFQTFTDMLVSLAADAKTNKHRYVFIKGQLNSDGSYTPTLHNFEVAYNTYSTSVEAMMFPGPSAITNETLDNNTLTGLAAGPKLGKNLWQDIPGASLDATHWTLGGDLFAGAAEAGTITEAANVRAYSNSATGGGNNAKSIKSVLTFSGDGTWQIDFTNYVASGNRSYLIFTLFVDATHYVRLMRYKQDSTSSISWRCYNGSSKEEPSFSTTATSFSFKIVRSTNDWHGYYNVGAGWVELSTALSHGQNIGTPYLAVQVSANDLGTDPSVSADDTGIYCTDTNVYWDTDPVVTIASQSTTAGYKIPCGSAIMTGDASCLLDIKFGTGAWNAGLDQAALVALGDQVTDDGTVTIRTTHGGSTAQSGLTALDLGTPVAPMVASGRGVMRGVGLGVMLGVG